jgi:hypothetical protein
MTMGQAMLPGMEDMLPLFSGTPMQVSRKAAVPAAGGSAASQQSFATCGLCRDTGRLNHADRQHYCWCAPGDAAREKDREKGASLREVTLSTGRESFAGAVSIRDDWVPQDDLT